MSEELWRRGAGELAGLIAAREVSAREVVDAEPPHYELALDVWGRFLFCDIRAQEPLLRQVMGPAAIRFLDYAGELFPLLGRTPPPWRWPAAMLATSVGTHVAYVGAVAAVDDGLRR